MDRTEPRLPRQSVHKGFKTQRWHVRWRSCTGGCGGQAPGFGWVSLKKKKEVNTYYCSVKHIIMSSAWCMLSLQYMESKVTSPHFSERKKRAKTVKYHILRRKMTQSGAPQRKLTWSAMEQIRWEAFFLYVSPATWKIKSSTLPNM